MNGDFKWRHFVGEIILWAVRWYCKYGVSCRDLEEMMEERGVELDHTMLYRSVQRYAPEIEKRLRWVWRRPTGRWHADGPKHNDPLQGCIEGDLAEKWYD